jgi:hypothetical protein
MTPMSSLISHYHERQHVVFDDTQVIFCIMSSLVALIKNMARQYYSWQHP